MEPHQEDVMSTLSIIGKGNMGQAIADVARQGGHQVEVLGRAESETRQPSGEIVVLAVPYPAVADVLDRHAEALAGKVVVDITNPLNFETFDSLTVEADSSATAEIAAALPESKVVKAFNTTFAGALASREVAGQTTTVLIAGDDAEAKAEVAEVIRSGGLNAVDAGSLRRARELEALGMLQITLAASGKTSWAGGFAFAG
jgi:NADPH-dependent F420 reductase